MQVIKKAVSTEHEYAAMWYDHVKNLENLSKAHYISKLTETISDLSNYLLQEYFIFVSVPYLKHIKSVLSFQYHPAQLYRVTAHSRSGKQCVLSKIQGKGWGETKGIGRQISWFRFAWRLLTLGRFEQVMSWLW